MRSGFAGADLETLAGLTVAGGAQRQQAGRRQERIHAILEAPGAEQPHWILLRRRRGWSKRRARPADAHSEISGSANDAGVAARSRIHGVAPAHHLMMVVEAPRRRRRRQNALGDFKDWASAIQESEMDGWPTPGPRTVKPARRAHPAAHP